MSFYNVANPTSFGIVSDTRKQKTAQGKLTRTGDVQSFAVTANGTLTAEQLIGGVLFLAPTSTYTMTLPSATDFITLLMGPLNYDISNGDIFTFRVFNTNATNAVSIAVSSSGGSGSSISVPAGQNKAINLQVSITTTGGSTTYGYTMF